ncbi:MAG TPA: hypothetical protein DDW21_01035, partial [Verrucomicrobiales bacterium]|nr:hypothetical protein [Verrucomicrobiales bacterium]
MQGWGMTFVTRTISALRAIFLPMRLARHFSHVMRMRATGSIDVKFSAASEESARGVSCKSSRITLSRCAIVFAATISLAHAADSDFDGLDDAVETNTGVYVSASNTGTDPTKADTDGDGVPDGLEVKERTSPVDATKFNSFSKGLVAYYPLDKSGADETGSGYNGNLSNSSLESVDGAKVLKAISNSPSGILIPNGGQLPLPATGWAISGWIKCIDFSDAPSPNGYFTLYESGDISGSQQSAINLSYSAHGLNLQITGFDDYPSNKAYLHQKFYKTNDTTSDTLRAGQWHHIMVVVSGSEISSFVDGSRLIGSTRGGSTWSGQAPKRTARAAGIGLTGQGGNTPNKSYIKNIRIYERSLAFWEVLNLFHSDRIR